MNKAAKKIPLSVYVLDLSKKNLASSVFCATNSPARKKYFPLCKKVIGFALLLFFSVSSIFGASLYKKFSEMKSQAFAANAMSAENIATLGKMLEIIQYLPSTGEAKKIKDLASDFESFKNILGFDWPKKYLLVFQNPSEMRATGGFIGSVGVLDIRGARIKNIRFQDVYNLDGQLTVNAAPPWPIKKISASWSLHDANWFFDFPSSAEKISWFYEKGGGETVDGVIAVNPAVVKDILKITGPIKIPNFDVALDEGNFIDLTQSQVEAEYDKTINQPKLFLADFMKELKETVYALPLDKKIILMKNFIANLDHKDIQVMLKNTGAQSFIKEHNWSGQVNETDKDYLAIVHSNINGFKTDSVVDEKIELDTEIAEDGSLVNTLNITRTHNGKETDEEWYKKVNSDYLRIYAPKGSELIDASGLTKEEPFLKDPAADYSQYLQDDILALQEKNKIRDEARGVEIFEESGKTVFGSWVYVSPGENVAVSFRYRVPVKALLNQKTKTVSYGLLFQKQSGSRTEKMEQNIAFPKNWKVLGNYAGDFSAAAGEIKRTLNIQGDKFASVLFAND